MTGAHGTTQCTYSAPIVSKAMKVLKMIVTSSRNPGISEIAAKLSLAKSTTHGILAALEESGWVLRDPVTRRYTCGHAVRDIGRFANVRIPLVEKARPHLEKLGAELDEDIFLGICIGTQLLILDQMESSRDMKITARPGTRLPLFAGGAGKIFLAFHEREAVIKIVTAKPLPRYTAKSITDADEFLAELDNIRESGAALDMGEYLPNVWSVGLPIFYGRRNRKRMVAGFWVVGISSAETVQRMEAAERLGRIAAEGISRAIASYSQENGS